MAPISLVYITASNKEEALRIGKGLLNEKLAACINVYDSMTALYRWEGKIEESQEATLIVKTRKELLPEMKTRVKEIHSYLCPCIVAIDISDADADYASWIVKETKVPG